MTTSPYPFACRICGEVVDIKPCETDEHGNAVHTDCYLRKVPVAEVPEKPLNTILQVAKLGPTHKDNSRAEFTYPDWQTPYHEALVDTDYSRLKKKILDAEAAIYKRREELGPISSGSASEEVTAKNSERIAISDAIFGLNVLRSEIGHRTRNR